MGNNKDDMYYQSKTLEQNEERQKFMDEQYVDLKGKEVPMPEHWCAYILQPESIEFFDANVYYVERKQYTKVDGEWEDIFLSA